MRTRSLGFLVLLSALLMMQVGCAKQLGQRLCEDNQCYGQAVWQRALDQVAAHNFPEDAYYGKVYADDLNNAWTTHNNDVNISEDLLRKLIDLGDAYVASVSAHEIAHIRSNHYFSKAGISYISALGSMITDIFTHEGHEEGSPETHQAVAELSRQHELEADRLAVQYLVNSGYRREDYLNFLKWMGGNLKDAEASDLATHPSFQERIARIEQLGK